MPINIVVASPLQNRTTGELCAVITVIGGAAETRNYEPFGEIDQTLGGLDVEETKGFIGERYDTDAGLHYLNARYYDPALGMFIQPDWFEITKVGVGTNRYSYSANDPVNMSDRGGNQFNNPRPGGAGPTLIGGSRTIAESLILGAMATSLGIIGSNGDVGPPGIKWGGANSGAVDGNIAVRDSKGNCWDNAVVEVALFTMFPKAIVP